MTTSQGGLSMFNPKSPSAKFQKTLHAGIAKLDDKLRPPPEAYLEVGYL